MMNYTKDGKRRLKDSAKCTRCDWVWIPRKPEPIACPHCKSYEWRGHCEVRPNAETRKAIKEARTGKGLSSAKSIKDLLGDLNI